MKIRSLEEHASHLSLKPTTKRKTKSNCGRMVLLSAGESTSRHFNIEVIGRDVETAEIIRVGIPQRDHDSDWEVRFAECDDLAEWCVGPHPGYEEGIRLIGRAKHGLVPTEMARRWARPVKGSGILSCPFILEQSYHDRPSIMVIGDYPRTEIELVDLNHEANESIVDEYVDALFNRAAFACWEPNTVRIRSTKPPPDSFPDFLAGADSSNYNPDEAIGERVTNLAPFPVLHTWLTAKPFLAGKRAHRNVSTSTETKGKTKDEDGDGRIRHLILAFKPDIIVAGGEEVIRRLGMILRPIIDQASGQAHVTFRHDLPSTPANMSLWGPELVHFRDGYFRQVIPVYDLRYFRQQKAQRRALPHGYWEMFSAVLRNRIQSGRLPFLSEIAPVPGKTYWF